MKFTNFVRYRDLDRIAAARPAHFSYADRLREQGKLAVGGPLVDEGGRRVGLLFIYEARSREEALGFAEEDPFTLADALSSYEVREFRLRGASSDLLKQANQVAHRSGDESSRIRLFANYTKYVADKARLETARPAHWAYDRVLRETGRLAMAGPLAGNEGGLFVYGAASRAEALSCLERDPFALEGVFSNYELFGWIIEGLNPDLLTIDFPAATDDRGVSLHT